MRTILTLILLVLVAPVTLRAAEVRAAWQLEWDQTVEAAKKEGKVVAGIPASAELRKAARSETFSKRIFPGIEIEIVAEPRPGRTPARSPQSTPPAMRYFDLLHQRHVDTIASTVSSTPAIARTDRTLC